MLEEGLTISLFKWSAFFVIEVLPFNLPIQFFVFFSFVVCAFWSSMDFWFPCNFCSFCCFLLSFIAWRSNHGGWLSLLTLTVSIGTDSSIAYLKSLEKWSHNPGHWTSAQAYYRYHSLISEFNIVCLAVDMNLSNMFILVGEATIFHLCSDYTVVTESGCNDFCWANNWGIIDA